MHRCPFCAEVIDVAAVICPHCRRRLTELDKPIWARNYHVGWMLGVLLLIGGAFFWPLWIFAAAAFIAAANRDLRR